MVIETYLNEIGGYSVLTPEQEFELAKKAKAGDKSAKELFINSNLKLVVSIAKKYASNGNLEDIIQEGNTGLLRAFELFDPDKGFRFSTYATWTIRSAIWRSINGCGLIRLPEDQKQLQGQVFKVVESYLKEHGCMPSYKQIASMLENGYCAKKIEELFMIYETAKNPLSLDNPIFDDDKGTLKDIIHDEKVQRPDKLTEDFQLKEYRYSILNSLKPREREMIKLRYGDDDREPMTLSDIGRQFHITQERVRQIIQKALDKLRYKVTRNKNLRDSYTDGLLGLHKAIFSSGEIMPRNNGYQTYSTNSSSKSARQKRSSSGKASRKENTNSYRKKQMLADMLKDYGITPSTLKMPVSEIEMILNSVKRETVAINNMERPVIPSSRSRLFSQYRGQIVEYLKPWVEVKAYYPLKLYQALAYFFESKIKLTPQKPL